MDIVEIAKGKFVSALRILWQTLVDAEMPFGILREPVATNELIFLLG